MNFSTFKNLLVHKNKILATVSLVLLITLPSLRAQPHPAIKEYSTVSTGAMRFEAYLPLLMNQRVAILTNVSGRVGNASLVDTLLSRGVNVRKIFGPEHGFRADTDAGEKVQSSTDAKTGLPVISLYGSNKKPSGEQLADIDVLVYDIQDLGVRFYTYISTMCYAMEACAEHNKKFIVLDRPNPNGFYIDGPVLKPEVKSFLGLHPVPLVYGMTSGEYALMANQEGWLSGGKSCSLTVIPMTGYDRKCTYPLPVNPSPNIPNANAVLLYPSLGLFEGTIMSLGRGTDFPFEVIGHPAYPASNFSFIPKPGKVSLKPKYMNQTCYGLDLRQDPYTDHHPGRLELRWLIETYSLMKDSAFFDRNFDFHAGNKTLRKQICRGMSEDKIRSSWQKDLHNFKKTRKKHLLYPDFE